MKNLVAIIICLVASQCFACGSERWLVKVLQDKTFDADLISGDPQLETVGVMRNLPRPSKPPKDSRTPLERRYVYAPVIIRGFKLEADGDFHVVIAAENKPTLTMIAEVPDPQCANKDYAPQFGEVRTALAKLATPKAVGKMVWFQNPPRAIIEGLLFFDKLHGQTGVAPNGIEIHPILKLTVQ